MKKRGDKADDKHLVDSRSPRRGNVRKNREEPQSPPGGGRRYSTPPSDHSSVGKQKNYSPKNKGKIKRANTPQFVSCSFGVGSSDLLAP